MTGRDIQQAARARKRAVTLSNRLVLGNTSMKVGIGTSAPATTLHVAGSGSSVRLEGLAGTGGRSGTVDAGGNLSAAGQSGTATLGSSGTALATYPSTFGTACSATPKVVCTVRTQTGQTHTDTFAVTTKSVGTTGFTVNGQRVDSIGSWGQTQLPDWNALPEGGAAAPAVGAKTAAAVDQRPPAGGGRRLLLR